MVFPPFARDSTTDVFRNSSLIPTDQTFLGALSVSGAGRHVNRPSVSQFLVHSVFCNPVILCCRLRCESDKTRDHPGASAGRGGKRLIGSFSHLDLHHGALSSLHLEKSAVPDWVFLVHASVDERIYFTVGWKIPFN